MTITISKIYKKYKSLSLNLKPACTSPFVCRIHRILIWTEYPRQLLLHVCYTVVKEMMSMWAFGNGHRYQYAENWRWFDNATVTFTLATDLGIGLRFECGHRSESNMYKIECRLNWQWAEENWIKEIENLDQVLWGCIKGRLVVYTLYVLYL